MSRQMSSRIKAAFREWDKDGNGTISREELSSLLQGLGSFSDMDIELLMREADRNGDGVIDYSEFVNWLTKPGQSLAGATLLSQSELCIRAETALAASKVQGRSPHEVRGVPAWEFGADKGPVSLRKAVLLDREFTFALWVWLEVDKVVDWVPLLGDTMWGLKIGISPSGGFGVHDPRALPAKCTEGPVGLSGTWMLLFISGFCDSSGPGPAGKTEFFIAADAGGVREVGSVDSVASGLVVSEFGSNCTGLLGVASLTAWQRTLGEDEMLEVFTWDAVRLGCVTDSQAAWLRLGRKQAPRRSEEEEDLVRVRLAAAAAGKAKAHTLDLSGLKIADADLPRVLEAVLSSFDGVSCLLLSNNYITDDGVVEHIVPFLADLVSPFRLSLSGNKNIIGTAEFALLSSVPFRLGCSVDARGTRLSRAAAAKLLNNGAEAAVALQAAAQENQRTFEACQAFDRSQADLKKRWNDECDEGVPVLEEADGSEFAGSSPPSALAAFPLGNKEKLRELRHELSAAAMKQYDRTSGPGYAWTIGRSKKPPIKCGSGQIMAHFAYLSYSVVLRKPEDFGLRLRMAGENSVVDGRGLGVLDLQHAVESGVAQVEAVSGKSYGRDAVTLRVKNTSPGPLHILVVAGTVFEHISWVHRQNLLVGRTVPFELGVGQTMEKKVGAYCMNLSCGCAEGDPMYLTSFLYDDKSVLASQAKVWDHFEGLFRQYREATGLEKAAGKKLVKKKSR